MGVRALFARVVTAAIVLALSLFAAVASAEEPCPDDAATCGKREFEAGIAAYRANDFRQAVERFTKAYEHRAHPVVLFNLALAQAKLELYLEALSSYDKVVSDAQTPKDLLRQAREQRAAVERKIAVIEVDVAEGGEAYVDERRVQGSPARAEVNPGEHRVRVMADGREILARSVRVASGERLRLAVDRAREIFVTPEPRGAKPGGHDAGARPSSGLSPMWFWISAGATLVAGGAATWSAIDTKRAFDDYERDLPTLDQAEVNRRVDQGHDKELRTNLLIGATAAFAVGTAVLGIFVVDWKGGSKRAGLAVGPGRVGAFGSF